KMNISYSPKEFVGLIKNDNKKKHVLKSIKEKKMSSINESHFSDSNVELIITSTTELSNTIDNQITNLFNPFKITGSKVLFVPQDKELTSIKKILYITDIRYCDIMVIKS